ncbi:MAG: cytochrome c oxidase accessory protein CcoG [Prosthecobacter sp.]|jgi:cytochrome c oxidase accessory protein FixG|uniref:cytochrome c oxidase accessory protein CcoG n=1 Tax=Prosthecobacter sp. TaxID=1965333 RepID=UPI001A0BE7E4|nr:cytochrome c oxidase accessory protein CcoG [Prosthecobacter sp.]MBE2283966.1 cytochrome c oxidase accessory protein CcoG [Prosthecobacter sp.]
MKPSTPTLESLSTINADGSRKFVHPADVRGPFTFWRRVVALVLLAIYVGLPWIPVNGFPAVFLDVQERRFHFFGLTLATQDLWIGFFLVTGLAFSLFYVTSLFGRIWCGWTCPYSVFMEQVYRRVERWIDGDGPNRRRLEDAPWTAQKIARRVFKHAIFIAISAAIAHVFLSYFVSIKALYEMMHHSPAQHAKAFGVVVFLTAALYGSFSWFREQFCIILCPYGRLQSALTDDNSVVIGYDKKRGEPRGKATVEKPAGDCVDCRRCVQVCPTGIDIRNGLQLECIGCAACVDACDDIMAKLGRPKGLVRYDSYTGLNGGRTRLIRPRTIFYACVLLVGMVAFSIATTRISPLRASVVRMGGASFYVDNGIIRNQFQLRVINKRNDSSTYTIELIGEVPPSLQVIGEDQTLTLKPMAEELKTLVVTLPQADYKRPIKFRVKVSDAARGDSMETRVMEYLGPNVQTGPASSLDVKDFIH